MKKILTFLGIFLVMLAIPCTIKATVSETDVAKIGDTGYATFKAAATASVSGNTIEILKNNTVADDITIKSGVKVKIPATASVTFNGKVIFGSGTTLENNGSIVVGGTLDLENMPSVLASITGYILGLDGTISIQANGRVILPTAFGEWLPTDSGSDDLLKVNLQKNAALEIASSSYIYTGSNTNSEGTGYDRTKWVGAVSIGNNHYTTLKSAFAAAQNNDTIVLNTTVKMTQSIGVGNAGEKITLNLNGNDIIISNNSYFSILDCKLNVTGAGTIIHTYNASNQLTFSLFGSDDSTKTEYSTLTLGKDVVVNALEKGVIVQGWPDASSAYGVKVDIYGKILIPDPNGCTVYVQGNVKKKTGPIPQINIHPGAWLEVDGAEGSTIYAAGYASWNIEGAKVIGYGSALSIKAGKISIKDSQFTAKGADDTPTTPFTGGVNASGAAIQIESNKNYAGDIELVIDGGTFVSNNSATIYEYVESSTAITKVSKLDIKNGKFTSNGKSVFLISEELALLDLINVTGGTFITTPSKHLANGYRTFINDEDYFEVGKITIAQGNKSITGVVTGAANIVYLKQGGIVVQTSQIANDGGYQFTNVPKGSYNVVAEGNNSNITKFVKVDNANVVLNITLPASGMQDVVVIGEDTPNVVVKGLENIAPTLRTDAIVEIIPLNSDLPGLEEIKEEASNSSIMVLDLNIFVDYEAVHDLGANILEFVIPFKETGATNLELLRYHNGEVQPFTLLNALPEVPEDLTFYYDKDAKEIHIFASQFSLHALTYTAALNPQTGDNITTSIIIGIISLLGICTILYTKKRYS